MEDDTCYCCDRPATTDEHAPPKCVFPKKKHLPREWPDLRRNLLTVPSCEEHNTKKSSDDEYFAVVVALSSDTPVALKLAKKKWHEALSRRNASLLHRILDGSKKVTLPGGTETIALKVEMERVNNVLISLSKALYFHATGGLKLVGGNWTIRSPSLRNPDLTEPDKLNEIMKLQRAFRHLNLINFPGLTLRGENLAAFYYQMLDLNPRRVFRYVFYETTEFFCIREGF